MAWAAPRPATGACSPHSAERPGHGPYGPGSWHSRYYTIRQSGDALPGKFVGARGVTGGACLRAPRPRPLVTRAANKTADVPR
jgi:hypothetical protein